MQRCPDAFREEDHENAQLLLDNMDLGTFESIREYSMCVVEWLGR